MVLLSVITICKNEKFIKDTCESIKSQTFKNFERIVIDGASSDNTLDILNLYKNLMTVFISENDNGIYNALNKGIKNATGDYLIFMNGGDLFYDSNVIYKVIPYLKKGNADIYYGDSYRLFEKKEDCFIKTYPDILCKNFFLSNTLAHQSSFIRRKLFDKYGLYREDFKIVSDKEKWLCFFDNFVKFEHLQFVCSCFRMNGVSRKKTEELKNEKIRMYEKYYPKDVLLDFNIY